MTAKRLALSEGSGTVRHVLTASGLLKVFDDHRPPVPLCSTGFVEVDELTGGMVPGRVWVVTSTPGQGRTTLLTQWAAAIASQRDTLVHLVTPREPPASLAARLLSLTARLALPDLSTHQLDRVPPERMAVARERVARLSLRLYAAGGMVYVPEAHPHSATEKASAVVIDDADLVSGVSPESAASLAATGAFVLISLPLHHVAVGSPAEDLDPGWGRVADAVLEVRHHGFVGGDLRPGEADLTIRYNRWGFGRTVQVLYQAHYSRFMEVSR